MQYTVSSVEETEKVAKILSESLTAGDVVALFGDLGAGKTHFVSGLAKALGFEGETYSPTFAIINEYLGGKYPIYHFDMYRISTWDDLYTTNYDEYLAEGRGILAIEWAENIEGALPDIYHKVEILNTGNNTRNIIISKVQK